MQQVYVAFYNVSYLLTCNTARVGREGKKYLKNPSIVVDSVPTTYQLLSYCIEIYCMSLGRWRATVACENKKKNKDGKEKSAKIMSVSNIENKKKNKDGKERSAKIMSEGNIVHA